MTRLIKITRSSTDHASLSVRPVAGNHCTWSSRSLTALVSVRYRCRTRVTVDLHGRSRPCLPRVGPPGTRSPSLPARSAPPSAGRNGPAAVGTMGAGLRRCGRDKRGEVVPDCSLAISDIDGLYRKIVFDCAKRVSGPKRETTVIRTPAGVELKSRNIPAFTFATEYRWTDRCAPPDRFRIAAHGT